MPDPINLRCPGCGQIRTPVINPLIPDRVLVLCETCWQRHLTRRLDEAPGRLPSPNPQPPTRS